MILTKEQQAELQCRYDEAYAAKGDTLTWSDLYAVRHLYLEELRSQIRPDVVKTATEQSSISGEQ